MAEHVPDTSHPRTEPEVSNTTHPFPKRIDVHTHFLPPFYRTALSQNNHSHPDGMPAIPAWSPSAHLDMMSKANITKSILSISSPGTHLDHSNDSLGVQLTRECNAYAADLKKQYPDKFGYWAALPLPNIHAALEEVEKSWTDGTDGFGLMTNYHGTYLGAPAFDPIFARLNELRATVFIHPTAPCIEHPSTTENTSSASSTSSACPLQSHYPIPVFEFFFDTARAIIHLFTSGTIDRCPNIRFIVPHAGGALPPLFTRFIQFSRVVPGGRVLDPASVQQQLHSQFYFDLAGFVFDGEEGGEGQLKALVKGFGVSSERLVYGSDFPFTATRFVEMFAGRMRVGLEELFGEEEREGIYHGNAEKLLAERKYGGE